MFDCGYKSEYMAGQREKFVRYYKDFLQSIVGHNASSREGGIEDYCLISPLSSTIKTLIFNRSLLLFLN